jgi:DNA processing protein
VSATPACSDFGERRAALALAFVEGVGCVEYRERVGRFGSPAAAFIESVPKAMRGRVLAEAESALEAAERAGARLLVLGDAEYPKSLLDLPDPPAFLFTLGSLAALAVPALSVVGTRRATGAGERTAYRFGAAVAAAGGSLVSGMALGIDAAAHQGALDANGTTVAVLGGGVDVPYPRSSRGLYDAIKERGVVISEAVPGTPPLSHNFPRRNRIIAALGQAVVVVEAGARSGARITAEAAMDIGRPVGAVPGSIDVPQCEGSNALLRTGAAVIAGPEDALLLAGLSARPGQANAATASASPADENGVIFSADDPETRAVLGAVRHGAANLVDVARETSLPARTIGAALVALEIGGVLWTDHMGAIRLSR